MTAMRKALLVVSLRARGGFEVGADWKDGKASRIQIRSLLGKPCRVRFGDTVKEFKTKAGGVYRVP